MSLLLSSTDSHAPLGNGDHKRMTRKKVDGWAYAVSRETWRNCNAHAEDLQ
jgi:hypothetical protein